MATRAPCVRSFLAMASPRPEAAPVMTAACPWNWPIIRIDGFLPDLSMILYYIFGSVLKTKEGKNLRRGSKPAIAIVIGTMLTVAKAAEAPQRPLEHGSGQSNTDSGSAMQCDLTGYKESPGLKAEMSLDGLRVTWQGEKGQDLRVSFGLRNAEPVIREMAVRRQDGRWSALGRDLSPEFHVTAGRRRISEQ